MPVGIRSSVAITTVDEALASPLKRQRTTLTPDGGVTREEEYRSVDELTAQDQAAQAASGGVVRRWLRIGAVKVRC